MGNPASRKMKKEPFAVLVPEDNVGLGDREQQTDPGGRIAGLGDEWRDSRGHTEVQMESRVLLCKDRVEDHFSHWKAELFFSERSYAFSLTYVLCGPCKRPNFRYSVRILTCELGSRKKKSGLVTKM